MDTVHLYRDAEKGGPRWRWNRTTDKGDVVMSSSGAFSRREDAEANIKRVNTPDTGDYNLKVEE